MAVGQALAQETPHLVERISWEHERFTRSLELKVRPPDSWRSPLSA